MSKRTRDPATCKHDGYVRYSSPLFCTQCQSEFGEGIPHIEPKEELPKEEREDRFSPGIPMDGPVRFLPARKMVTLGVFAKLKLPGEDT